MEQQKLLERRQAVLAVENCICYKPDRGDAICQTRCVKRSSGPRENESGIRGIFFAIKKRPSTHHIYHAIHHKLTIQKPRSAPHFLQKPLQKHQNRSPQKYSLKLLPAR
jgi:hypothetical protein